MSAQTVDLTTFADTRPITAFQLKGLALCGCLMLIDGFDNQIISYMAPHIARELALAEIELGVIFSVGLFGVVLGNLFVSPVAHRIGHKRVLVLCAASLSVLNMIGPWLHSLAALVVLRLFMGIALGAVVPSSIALTSIYSPRRRRASAILIMTCFLTVGYVVAGPVSAFVIPEYGWRGMFWAGCLVSSLVVPALALGLPECPAYLAGRGDEGRRKAIQIARRIDPAISDSAVLLAGSGPAGVSRLSVASLFMERRALGTLLLWLTFLFNGALGYALQSWLPTILTILGRGSSDIVLATSVNAAGGVITALSVGPIMDRTGPYVTLGVLYFAGSAFLLLLGFSLTGSLDHLLLACFLSGGCVFGGQMSVIALASLFYRQDLQSVGIGWALAAGRLGGILGPMAVGIAIGFDMSPQTVVSLLGLPLLAMAGSVAVVRARYANA